MLNFYGAFDERSSSIETVSRLLEKSFCTMNHYNSHRRMSWGISKLRSTCLNGVSVCSAEGFGRQSVTRTRAQVLADGRSDFIVVIPTERKVHISQSGVLTSCEPEHLCVLSTDIPFSGYVTVANAGERHSELLASIPGAMLRDAVPGIDCLSNLPIPVNRGAIALIKNLFKFALDEGRDLSSDETAELNTMLVRALGVAIVQSAEYKSVSGNRPHGSRARIQEKACQFIMHSLADPELDCRAVAEHCNVSVRYLHQIFSEPLTVAKYIRIERLKNCRASLRDPRLAGKSVKSIAATWGFIDNTSFHRAYKNQYGIAPGADRLIR